MRFWNFRFWKSKEVYDEFLYSGFGVLLCDDSRTVEETLKIAEEMLRIKI